MSDLPHHLHKTLQLTPRDQVLVSVNAPAGVYLLDDENYELYLAGEEHEYYGQVVRRSPFGLGAPYSGVWHLVIEQEDPAVTLQVGIQIIS